MRPAEGRTLQASCPDPVSPNFNAYPEGLVQSMQRECLVKFVNIGKKQPRREPFTLT